MRGRGKALPQVPPCGEGGARFQTHTSLPWACSQQPTRWGTLGRLFRNSLPDLGGVGTILSPVLALAPPRGTAKCGWEAVGTA